MSLLSSSAGGILAPEDVQSLVVEPLLRMAIAPQVSSVVSTSRHTTRFPIVVSDPTAAWTPEGSEINVTDPDVDELEVTPSKLAALVVVSRELVMDSDPAALQVVGDGLIRDLQIRLDAAYFGTTTTNGPSGLGSLTGVQTVSVASITNLDPFAQALSLGETVDVTTPHSFVMHPSMLLTLSELKVADGWHQPLLGPDASSPTKRSILGTPVYWSLQCDASTIWAVPTQKAFVVMREGTEVFTDQSAFFSSDRIGVRATMRVGFAFPHQAAVVKIVVGGGS